MTTIETQIPPTQFPLGARRNDPFVFRQFFELGLEESASPFLNKRARILSRHLSLKVAIFSAILLFLAYFIQIRELSEILLIAVYVMVGCPSLIDSIEDVVFERDVNIDVLMTIAAFSAYFLGAGFEGALLLVLFAISGALENLVTLKAKNALSAVHALAATKAYLIDENKLIKERAVEDVPVGAIILVRAGEIVPLDGVVVDGASSISLAHLTGENLPIRKKIHDEVPAGARLLEGSLTIRVLTSAADSTISRIIQLITKAQEARPTLERWFDRFARRYAVSIIAISFIAAVSFASFLGLPYLGQEGAIYRALAFLITASPCALILAVPIAYLSALGACAKKGIVLKGGVILDDLNECKVIAFDKTGTLTLGELVFSSLEEVSSKSFSKTQVIGIAASLERNTVHPVAKAIMQIAETEKTPLFPVTQVRVVPGLGVEGKVLFENQEIQAFIGDVKAVDRLLRPDAAEKAHAIARRMQAEGLIVAALCIGDRGYLLCFQDKVRPRVEQMITTLKKMGKTLVMLTGDHEENASQIARLVGIQEYYANLRPEDKLEKITTLASSYGLAMVGDGINDAPALARATVGICMGKVGSGTAQLVADCILLNDNIELLDWLFEKALQTKKIVNQNLVIALSAIFFASLGALYGVVPLWLAVILHEGGTVCVGLNAIRLLRK